MHVTILPSLCPKILIIDQNPLIQQEVNYYWIQSDTPTLNDVHHSYHKNLRLGEQYTSFCIPYYSIRIRKCHSILFYHLKKLLYQLYHTILQHTQHPKILFYHTIH